MRLRILERIDLHVRDGIFYRIAIFDITHHMRQDTPFMDTVPDHDETACLGRRTTVEIAQNPVGSLFDTLLVLADLGIVDIINNDQVRT